VSSRLSWPSKATPRLFMLLDKAGVRYITFCSDDPGLIGHPSLLKTLVVALDLV